MDISEAHADDWIVQNQTERLNHRDVCRDRWTGTVDEAYPDLQPLDLSQVGFLSLLQPPPLRILLLNKLHLSGETRGRGESNVLSRCVCVCVLAQESKIHSSYDILSYPVMLNQSCVYSLSEYNETTREKKVKSCFLMPISPFSLQAPCLSLCSSDLRHSSARRVFFLSVGFHSVCRARAN